MSASYGYPLGISAEAKNAQVLASLWKGFHCMFSQLLPNDQASNQPASRS